MKVAAFRADRLPLQIFFVAQLVAAMLVLFGEELVLGLGGAGLFVLGPPAVFLLARFGAHAEASAWWWSWCAAQELVVLTLLLVASTRHGWVRHHLVAYAIGFYLCFCSCNLGLVSAW